MDLTNNLVKYKEKKLLNYIFIYILHIVAFLKTTNSCSLFGKNGNATKNVTSNPNIIGPKFYSQFCHFGSQTYRTFLLMHNFPLFAIKLGQ